MTERAPPLVPLEVDLRGMEYMPLKGDILFKSTTWVKGSHEARCAALRLWWHSFSHEVPAASLPDDDHLLADYAGYGEVVKAWRRVREQALRGWVLCSDGRWYHQVVADLAIEAWKGRVKSRDKQQRYRDKLALESRPLLALPAPASERDRNGDGNVTTESESRSKSNSEEEDNAFALFVAAASKHGWPKPKTLDPARRKKLRARLNEHALDGWVLLLAKAEASEFLCVKWPLTFDWAINPSNFRKVIEGNYDNKTGAAPARPKSFAERAADAASTVASHDGDDQWRARLKNPQFWPVSIYGPPPGQPGCRVPRHLLAELRTP